MLEPSLYFGHFFVPHLDNTGSTVDVKYMLSGSSPPLPSSALVKCPYMTPAMNLIDDRSIVFQAKTKFVIPEEVYRVERGPSAVKCGLSRAEDIACTVLVRDYQRHSRSKAHLGWAFWLEECSGRFRHLACFFKILDSSLHAFGHGVHCTH